MSFEFVLMMRNVREKPVVLILWVKTTFGPFSSSEGKLMQQYSVVTFQTFYMLYFPIIKQFGDKLHVSSNW